jgi:hypothetical protein
MAFNLASSDTDGGLAMSDSVQSAPKSAVSVGYQWHMAAIVLDGIRDVVHHSSYLYVPDVHLFYILVSAGYI